MRNARSHLVSENLTFSQQYEKQNIGIAYDFGNKKHINYAEQHFQTEAASLLSLTKRQLANLVSNS